jgi:hypothetical protein
VAFEQEPVASSGIGCQFRQLIRGPLPTAQIADLIAFNFFEDTALRQELLAETDVRARIARTLSALSSALAAFAPASVGSGDRPGLN